MNRSRRHALRAGAAFGLGLAGLRVQACEFFASTLRVTHPWARATPQEAGVAIVCLRFDEVTEDDRLVGVQSMVAERAELGGPLGRRPVDLPIPRGEVMLLSEHGIHIRLLALTMPLELTRSYPMQLVFEKAGVLRTDLSIDYQRFL